MKNNLNIKMLFALAMMLSPVIPVGSAENALCSNLTKTEIDFSQCTLNTLGGDTYHIRNTTQGLYFLKNSDEIELNTRDIHCYNTRPLRLNDSVEQLLDALRSKMDLLSQMDSDLQLIHRSEIVDTNQTIGELIRALPGGELSLIISPNTTETRARCQALEQIARQNCREDQEVDPAVYNITLLESVASCHVARDALQGFMTRPPLSATNSDTEEEQPSGHADEQQGISGPARSSLTEPMHRQNGS